MIIVKKKLLKFSILSYNIQGKKEDKKNSIEFEVVCLVVLSKPFLGELFALSMMPFRT